MKSFLKVLFILSALVSFTLSGCAQDKMNHQENSESTMANNEQINKSEQEWKKELTEEEYRVLREQGTERAFTGKYVDHKEDGVYQCAACGNALFSSETKFKSGSGWPSFYDAINEENILLRDDNSMGMQRTEVVCGKCHSHLGHLFNDGPDPTGQRYCINSVALDFEKKE